MTYRPYRFFSRGKNLLRQLPTVIPSSCALCGMDARYALCTDCAQRFFQPCARCKQCGVSLDGGQDVDQCGACLLTPPAFNATLVACDYAAPLDHLVLALKFGNRLAFAPLLAGLLHDALLKSGKPLPDLLTIVPLGAQRLAQRGFNQSLEIARPLAKASNIPLLPALLVRTRETRMQAELPLNERQQNVRHAFLLPPKMRGCVEGKHIAVLDDVMTTGSTLGEIARLLKRNGAASVTNLVFARTRPS